MNASPPPAPSPARAVPVERSRRLVLALPESGVTPGRLGAYLCQVDRPVMALLARDRLERLEAGRYTYRSRPLRLLGFELVPTLQLRARWRDPWLEVTCEDCRILGLGPWERALAFTMSAVLAPGALGLEGELRVRLLPSPSLPGWGRSLAGRGLDQVVDRIERRVQGGLRKDLLTWMGDAAVSG
jgi:hypothetical protein